MNLFYDRLDPEAGLPLRKLATERQKFHNKVPVKLLSANFRSLNKQPHLSLLLLTYEGLSKIEKSRIRNKLECSCQE